MIRIIQLIVVCFLLNLSVYPLPASAQTFFFENDIVGSSAPDFTLNTLTEKDVNLTKFRDGQKAIIFFWATWCPHCRTQLTELNKQKEDIAKKGIKLVIVDMGEDKKKVERYVQTYKIDMPVFLDQESALADSYSLIGVPTFIFVNQEGVVKDVQHELPENYEEILSL